jgi:hypothetical protein
VSFFDGDLALGTVDYGDTLPVTLVAGVHSLRAEYSGYLTFEASVSGNTAYTTTEYAAPDVEPPRVTFTYPAADETSVPVFAEINVAFDEVATGVTLVLRHADTRDLIETVAQDFGNEWEFLPVASLTGDTEYEATISGATDAASNEMVDPYVWTFHTGATTFQATGARDLIFTPSGVTVATGEITTPRSV